MPPNKNSFRSFWHTFFSNLGDLLIDLLPNRKEIIPAHYFSPSDIAGFHNAERSANQSVGVDDHTWRDLDMDNYSKMISADVSILGRQMLYSRLRGCLPAAKVSANADRVTALLQDEKTLAALTKLCRPLRWAETETGSLFMTRTVFQRPGWSTHLALFQLALATSVLLLWFSSYALTGMVALILMACVLQLTHYSSVITWARKAKSLQLMLGVAAEVATFAANSRDRASAPFLALSCNPAKISRKLSCSSLGAAIPVVGEYLDWFFADNIRHYFISRHAFEIHASALEKCFREVADLEADIALANHLKRADHYCLATLTDAKVIELNGAVHPMLKESMPISVALRDRSAFISGKNGSGKSTFLRIIGVNLLVGRAFGFCYAEHAQVSRCPLYSSIRNEDSLEGGESLYTSELVRAKVLLDACKASGGAICLIDEIFRGTNHVESVSAAAAVLYEMAEDALIIVSSHNLILCPLLEQWFRPLHLERNADGKTISVADGLLVEPNGIELLARYGYGAAAQRRALHIAQWLNRYLAKPDSYPDVSKWD
jgi:hypothetical protein